MLLFTEEIINKMQSQIVLDEDNTSQDQIVRLSRESIVRFRQYYEYDRKGNANSIYYYFVPLNSISVLHTALDKYDRIGLIAVLKTGQELFVKIK